MEIGFTLLTQPRGTDNWEGILNTGPGPADLILFHKHCKVSLWLIAFGRNTLSLFSFHFKTKFDQHVHRLYSVSAKLTCCVDITFCGRTSECWICRSSDEQMDTWGDSMMHWVVEGGVAIPMYILQDLWKETEKMDYNSISYDCWTWVRVPFLEKVVFSKIWIMCSIPVMFCL